MSIILPLWRPGEKDTNAYEKGISMTDKVATVLFIYICVILNYYISTMTTDTSIQARENMTKLLIPSKTMCFAVHC